MDSVLGLIRHAGNDALFRALEMSVLATMSGMPLHLHAEGLRGTGKTTMMRAVKRMLPKIRRIKDCLYNCDPARPHCPRHRSLQADEVAAQGDEWVSMPFLEISHSARVGTVVGSVDLGRLVSPNRPEAALLPGTVPQAHRGIIFVDEINRLAETAPELADVLLDVMGTKPGRVQIEETGLPAVEFPVQVTVWAASNPDEDPGPLQDIRRQLSDRFDFGVHTKRPGDASVVAQILALSDAPDRPPGFEGAGAYQALLVERITALGTVQVPDIIRAEIAEIYNRHDLESLRAVQAMQHGVRLHACLEGRSEVGGEDMLQVVEMALYHRADYETRAKVMDFLRSRHVRQGEVAGVQARIPLPPSAEPVTQAWDTGGVGRPHERSPSLAQATTAPQTHQGVLRRFLSGLRERMGAVEQRPSRPFRTGHQHDDRHRTAQQAAPRPGRLFQNAQAGGDGGATGAPGGTGPGQREGAEAGGQGGGGQSPVQPLDPTKVALTAPPNPARPVAKLLPHEMLRTEEELGNR